MKLNTAKEVWIARFVAWLGITALACGIIFTTAFTIGPAVFGDSKISDRIMLALYCPGAQSSNLENGASAPTTSSPTGTYGHTVEITCSYADGSTKTIGGEQLALGTILSMFGGGGLLGLVISLPLYLLPFFLFRKKKPA